MDSNMDVVKLNVGGVHYTTTRATLTHFPQSMLGVMFSGSIPTAVDENERFFIDRDGQLFGYILNFLRSSHLSLPTDFKQMDLLSIEADFYQIQPLIDCIAKQRRAEMNGRYNLIEVIEVRMGPVATMPTNNTRDVTIISSRRDVISSLPLDFFRPDVVYKLQGNKLQGNVSEADFIELELLGSNVRLRLAEYLQNNGWTRTVSDMSTSSSSDGRTLNSIIIEHSYRDAWIKRTHSD